MNDIITIIKKMNNKPNEGVILSDFVEKSISLILSDSFDEALNSIVLVNNKKDISNAYLNFALQYGFALASIGIYNTTNVIRHLNERLFRAEDEVVQNLLKAVLKWIIPTDDLSSIIKSINDQKGFEFDQKTAYKRLFIYIGIKIQLAIVENLPINFPLSKNQSEGKYIVKVIANVNRRQQKSNQLDEFFDLMKSIIEPELEQLYDTPKPLMTIYHNMVSSKIDDLLIPIYKKCLKEVLPKFALRKSKKILQEKEKLRLAYPLFELVLKDKKWENKIFIFGKNKGKLDYRRQDQNLRKFIYKK